MKRALLVLLIASSCSNVANTGSDTPAFDTPGSDIAVEDAMARQDVPPDSVDVQNALDIPFVDMGDLPIIPGGCWPPSVTTTPCPYGPCSCVTFTGNLDSGGAGAVDWLVASDCVPAEEKALFSGSHVSFGTELSPWCGVNACVTPDDPDTILGIYAVRLDAKVCEIPPPEDTFVECDAAWSEETSLPYADDIWSQSCPEFNIIKGANTRCVIVTSGSYPQNYRVGVTGAEEQTSAGFTLHFGWRYDCGT
jgi:hypothetical protein